MITPLFRAATKPEAAYKEYDSSYPVVAAHLKATLEHGLLGLTIEHVGSTAILDCGGKGTIDLLAIYPPGELDRAKSYLLETGLSHQGPEFAHAWPESRPMLLGWYTHEGTDYLIYVHVVSSDNPEITRFRTFRDRLNANPDLRLRYIATKQSIIQSGATDTDEYARQKRPIIHEILGPDHKLADG